MITSGDLYNSLNNKPNGVASFALSIADTVGTTMKLEKIIKVISIENSTRQVSQRKVIFVTVCWNAAFRIAGIVDTQINAWFEKYAIEDRLQVD